MNGYGSGDPTGKIQHYKAVEFRMDLLTGTKNSVKFYVVN